MPTIITDTTETTVTKEIQFTWSEVLNALAVAAGVTAPDFGTGEGDTAELRRYDLKIDGVTLNNLLDTSGGGNAWVLAFVDNETV